MSKKDGSEKRGHVCPPSDAIHPKDRWETAFVYAYIVKFTQLKSKLDYFNSPMDLEDALRTPVGQTNQLLQDILTRFILTLRPQSRNISSSQLCATLWNLLNDFFRTNERSLFWDDSKRANVDPLLPLEGSFWNADWDLKLKILRQLVEYQLTHAPQVKEALDRAWGVKQMQHKKKDEKSMQPAEDDPLSQRNLLMEPIGQDFSKKRFWIVDNSPRLWVSTNPWKVASSFKAFSSSREEYVAAIEELKKEAPPEKPGSKKGRFEQAHSNLISVLEKRLEDIDAEFTRVERARKKVEQRNLLLAQAEVRGPRTRRQAQRPGYVYHDGISEEDEHDDYKIEDDEMNGIEEDHFGGGGGGGDDDDDAWGDFDALPRRTLRARKPRDSGLRRSTRQSNGKQEEEDDDFDEWRGERRSRRLGATVDMDLSEGPPRKRSRTVESSEAGASSLSLVEDHATNGAASGSDGSKTFLATGAAALKSTEVAVDSIMGKKKNKFWFYAVEPISAPSGETANGLPAEGDLPDEVPTERKSKVRRIINSAELSESQSGKERGLSPTPENSAPMSLDSEAVE